ncbi:MAG: hypothetical protein C0596_15525 [Marinilabiliales bacterium]|nr:MAG: hypothetical protein C0596_15525 [Marinilabiliales bacterium]
MDKLIAYIESIVLLTQEEKDLVSNLAEIEVYKKNDFVLEHGSRCNKIWFVKSGMLRKFHLFEGKEITSWIHIENDIVTSLSAYAQQTVSEEYIQACEDSELISITRSNSEKLAKYDSFKEFSNTLMEKEFVNIDIHTKMLNQLEAKGKFEYLCKIAPEIIKRAKLGYIASILGITQETLSRVRK